MVRTIPHRELRNNSSAILKSVSNGETINVTNHGEVVATLIPPLSDLPPLKVRPARIRGRFSELAPALAADGLTTQEVLDDLRGDG